MIQLQAMHRVQRPNNEKRANKIPTNVTIDAIQSKAKVPIDYLLEKMVMELFHLMEVFSFSLNKMTICTHMIDSV